MRAMLGRVDHVGYLVGELEPAIASFVERLGAPVVRRFERPQFSLLGAYLGAGHGDIELFTFSDARLLEQRLGGREIVLDHVAHEVEDIQAVATSLRRAGVRFSGPDLRGELSEPAELGGVLHLRTVPETCAGVALQLMQRL
jgi:catechol 2,3-dioxygenase-like lactoylglutathione lyase family enzyme